MANNDPQSRVPSWRKHAPTPPPASRAPGPNDAPPVGPTGTPGWKNRPPEARSSLGDWLKSKGAKITAALVLLGVVIAGLLLLPLLLRPLHPACLVLIGAPAEDNLAVDANVYGWQTLKRLNDWVATGDEDRKLPRLLQKEPKELKTLEDWDKGWTERGEKAVVVYLALHGGVDKDGPFFWLDSPDNAPAQRLSLATVLASLGKLPSGTQKVLILDPTQVAVNWHQGMMHNDFVTALLKMEPDIQKVANLVVICATDVEQHSWISEEWQQSIFGHYLVAGLRGSAIQGKGNNRLTMGDVYQYVRGRVESWVQTNRNRKQTPIILPRSGGKELADQIELGAVIEQPDPDPASAPGASFQVSAELEGVWKQSATLNQIVPAPGVYSPQRWREYRDLTLRYEEVVRAGDPRARGSELLRRINDLERAIRQAHGLNLASAASTLAMPVALGLTDPWTPGEIQDQFRNLWNALDEPARQKTWEAANKWLAGTSGAPERFRLQLAGLLLEQYASSPETAGVPRVNAIFQMLGTPRPAEAHLLFMYLYLTGRVIPHAAGEPTVPSGLIQQALRVRRMAEEVTLACDGLKGEHPYSETIFAWTQTQVEAADRERRLGEDLLFAPSSWWEQAAEHFNKSTELYQSASKDAKLIRQALTLRDRALADLPYYSRWLAAAPVDGPAAGGQDDETVVQELEQIWAGVHQLTQMLDTPRDPKERPARLPQIRDLLETKHLERDLDAALRRLVAYTENMGDAATQKNWHDHELILGVPLMTPVAVRKQRVETMRRISDDLNRKSLQNLAAHEQPVAALAARQGRIAWAVLGETNIRRLLPNQDTVWIRGLLRSTSGDWTAAVRQFGDFIGQCYRTMPEKIGELAQANPDRPDLARADLAVADLITRQLDGAGSRAAPRDPPVELRRLRWHELLIFQADRTDRDHWAAERAGEPYYRQIGLRYVDDAQSLVADKSKPPDKDPRLNDVRQARQRLALKPPLQIVAPEKFDWTSEPKVSFGYRLEPTPVVLPGLPVVWRQITAKQADNKPLGLVESKETDRFVVGEMGTAKPVQAVPHAVALVNRWLADDEKKPPQVPTKEPVPVTLHSVFRGHHIEHVTAVDLHRVPHTAGITYPRPEVGGVSLQADGGTLGRFGQANGVIVFALDMSGSMESQLRLKNNSVSTRLAEAKKALTKVLESLPSGPVVSLHVFGTANNIDSVWKPQVWDATPKTGSLPLLLAELDKFKPSRQVWSAVARTMVEHARKDFDVAAQKWPLQHAGFRSLLVLTDGEDNDFDKVSKKNISDYVKEAYKDAGVQVDMILFCSNAQETALARKQFGVIETLPIPGHIYEAADDVKLLDSMAQAMRRELKCRIERNGQPVPDPDTGRPMDAVGVGALNQSPRWFAPLAPHVYSLRAHTFRQDIDIGPGDFIQVAMLHDPKTRDIMFERALLGRNYAVKDRQQSRNWLLSCFQNMKTASDGLNMVAAVESTDVKPTIDERRNAARGTLLQVRPAFAWFAIHPAQGQPPMCLRVGNMERYPAPAWRLEVARWPQQDDKPLKPIVESWWTGDRALPPITQTLRRDPKKSLEEEFTNRPVQIEEGSAVIESVQLEKRPVYLYPEKTVEQTCLVVRARYPTNHPVVVLLAGVPVAGGEHRLYSDANKYTGIFWPVDEEKAKAISLQIVSLETFKQAASQPDLGVHHAKLEKLIEPQLFDPLLVPPVNYKEPKVPVK